VNNRRSKPMSSITNTARGTESDGAEASASNETGAHATQAPQVSLPVAPVPDAVADSGRIKIGAGFRRITARK
jgi:hypothetical protein